MKGKKVTIIPSPVGTLNFDPADVGNLISGSSAFSKTSLNIWKFTVHVFLRGLVLMYKSAHNFYWGLWGGK